MHSADNREISGSNPLIPTKSVGSPRVMQVNIWPCIAWRYPYRGINDTLVTHLFKLRIKLRGLLTESGGFATLTQRSLL